MRYRILGFAVWKGGTWYLRRRYGRWLPSRKMVAAGVVLVTVAALAAKGREEE